ncbi:ADP-ribosylation factor-like protein 6-interacting protein 6 [Clinocottus analis]|uniref:ADP-ribosylation factor-like protein 6-interacting protein 6 n=1 Tax=Clinocottus analis TaxID=304258 RepID=UPI0035BF8699
MSGQRPAAARPSARLWAAAALSVLGSAAAVAAAGGLCGLIYPVLTELRAERVRGPNWTEESVLGLWSVLVLSVLVGCICCLFSWTLTELDSCPLGSSLVRSRGVSDPGFHMGCGVALLNGVMAMLAVIWSLS